MAKSTPIGETIAKLRRERAALAAERETIAAAPRPAAEACERVQAYVARLAASRRPIAALFVGPGEFNPTARLVPHGEDPHAIVGLVAALVPDALEQLLLADVEAHLAEHQPGLPEAERAARIAEIDAEIRALEVREEVAIRDAERQGLVVTRRGDADVEVVLSTDERLEAA